MTWALQSTAKTFLVGPILDANGAAKTDEVVASIKVTKNGTVGAAHGSSTLTHNHTGHYLYVANGGDMDTLGEVEFSLNSGTNAMAPVVFQVQPANVYNSLVLGTAYLMADLKAILATALTETSAGYLAAAFKKFLDVATPVFTAACVNQTIDNPTAAAIGTDAAGKVLVTPAQKIVTDANGKVTYSNAAPPTVGEIRTELETAGGTLALTYTAAGNASTNASDAKTSADSAYAEAGNAKVAAAAAETGAGLAKTAADDASTAAGLAKTAADAVATILAGITSLGAWLRGLFRKDAMNSTAKTEINTGGGTFDEATDSLQAVRDTPPLGTAMRGTDGANTTTPPTTAQIKTALEVDGSKLDHLWETTEEDGGVRRFTADALAEAPTGSGTGLSAQETRDAMKLGPTAGDPAAGSIDKHLDDMQAKTGLIGTGGAVTIVSAVNAAGDVTIVAGADYKVADGRNLLWTDVPWSGPSLDGATLELRILPFASWKAGSGASALTVVASATSAGAGKIDVAADLTAAQTAALATRPPLREPPTHVFQIFAAVAGGSEICVLQGQMTVVRGIQE